MNEIGSRRRRRRRTLALTVCGGVVAVGAVAPAAAGTSFESTISIKNSSMGFHGRVQSGNEFCMDNREVRLFRSRLGIDKTLDTTPTDSNGRWQVLEQPKSGEAYYAKVRPSGSASLMIACRTNSSKVIFID